VDTHFHPEWIDPEAYVAPGSFVCGQVKLGARASIWFGAVVRGDTELIEIGSASNVQDHCVIHADPGYPCRIGCRVTLGHGATIHGATIADDCMIGIRAVVLNGATVQSNAIIGAGAVVTEGTVIPSGMLALGIPARPIRPCTPQDFARISHAATHYSNAIKVYQATWPSQHRP
jgi:carbonic anhydrase/acetyltransferase-like protein (isoleucine patch superfamily)